MCHVQPYSFRHFEIRLCGKNNLKSFPPLKNNSVTIGINYLLVSISAISTFLLFV